MEEFSRGVDHYLDRSVEIEKVVLPKELATVDGMIDKRERQLIYRLVRDHYTGRGFIIDGGMLLGASGVALAEGVRANPRRPVQVAGFPDRRIIQGFELGVLPASGPKRREVKVGATSIVMGESFLPVLAANVAPYADLIEIHPGDLKDRTWSPGQPIEICFIDVAKTPELNQHVFRQFFPALIPGQSYVLHQDLFFDRLPWIKVLMGYLHDHFTWLGQVGCTAVYRYTTPIPPEMFAIDPYRDLPGEDRIALHRRVEHDGLPVRRRFALALSLAYLVHEVRGPQAAAAQLDGIAVEFAAFIAEPSSGVTPAERLARARRAMGLPPAAAPPSGGDADLSRALTALVQAAEAVLAILADRQRA